MKKMLMIYNPRSGKAQFKTKISEIVEFYTTSGYDITVRPTLCEKDATNIVRTCAMNYDIIVFSGGDGTLNEVVNGLIGLPKYIPVGYIPSGTVNDFSSSLGLSKDIMTAAKTVLDGKTFACDLGSFNNSAFVYTAAFGLFTDVSYQTRQYRKNRFGRMAYILEGAKRLNNIPSYHVTLTSDDIVIRDEFLFGMVTNSISVGGFKVMTEDEIALNDGLFEVVLAKKPQSMNEIPFMIQCLLTKNLDAKYFYKLKSAKLEIETEENIDWTLDGEYGGTLQNVKIQNHKQSMHIIVDSDYGNSKLKNIG